MRERRKLPSQRELRCLLDYSPDTGVLTWRYRDGLPQRVAAHNKRFAGKAAGYRTKRGTNHYLVLEIDGLPTLAHRIIFKWMTSKEPPYMLDHADGDGTNNRWENIRPATDKDNQGNRRGKANGLPKGVRQGSRGSYQAFMTQRGKFVHLGSFKTPEAAHAAYLTAAREYFGEFARS